MNAQTVNAFIIFLGLIVPTILAFVFQKQIKLLFYQSIKDATKDATKEALQEVIREELPRIMEPFLQDLKVLLLQSALRKEIDEDVEQIRTINSALFGAESEEKQ